MGFELRLAANHWDRAIETHTANLPDADHLCADVSNYDMRRLPKTDVLWASPECTWSSPAGGRPRRRQADLFGDRLPSAAEQRSRMTMVDVIRAAEVHRYPVGLVENVIEVTDWELWDWWLTGMDKLGYRHQIVCVSSAHIWGDDNPPGPQWRDRIYVVYLDTCRDVGGPAGRGDVSRVMRSWASRQIRRSWWSPTRRVLCLEDFVAELDAAIADVDARPSDQLLDPAQRFPQCLPQNEHRWEPSTHLGLRLRSNMARA